MSPLHQGPPADDPELAAPNAPRLPPSPDLPAEPLAAPPRSYAEAISLLIFVFLVLAFAVVASLGDPSAEGRETFSEELELSVQGRYLVGTNAWFGQFLPDNEQNRAQMVDAVRALTLSGDRTWCAALLLRELGAKPDLAAISAKSSTAEGLATAFSLLLAEPPSLPTPEYQETIRGLCGFLGELGWAQATADTDDEAALLAAARTFSGIFLVGMMMAGLGLILGCLLAVAAFLCYRKGRLPAAYPPSIAVLPADALTANARVPYLELGSLFFLALFALGLVGSLLGEGPWPMLINWLILPVFLWPLRRARSWSEMRLALGWHRGRGLAREFGAGLVAYLAAAPLLLVGLFLTLLVSRWTTQAPYHPIVDWIREASTGGLAVAFLLAVLWAPLCEESVFRGALYHYGRGRFGSITAGLAVAVVFAAIHPQGLAGIPFLTSLALALALAREWRGSIVASMAMHLVHNLLVFLFMILVIR